MKSYNQLNDTQLKIIKEYKSWCKSSAPIAYKVEQIDFWAKRAKEENCYYGFIVL